MPAPNYFWTLPEAAERKQTPTSRTGSRKWRRLGEPKYPVVRANTKSEARARFKAMIAADHRCLSVGVVVAA